MPRVIDSFIPRAFFHEYDFDHFFSRANVPARAIGADIPGVDWDAVLPTLPAIRKLTLKPSGTVADRPKVR